MLLSEVLSSLHSWLHAVELGKNCPRNNKHHLQQVFKEEKSSQAKIFLPYLFTKAEPVIREDSIHKGRTCDEGFLMQVCYALSACAATAMGDGWNRISI